MKNVATVLIVGFALALIFLSPLHAQTAGSAPAAAKATAANTTPTNAAPAGQAPNDAMKKLSDLVHAGKYAEAQHLTSGLLVAYPNDERLIKAELLLEKSLAATSANATPGSNQPTGNVTSAQPAPNANSLQFTGIDKVEYNSLIELARQAQQTTDLDQQKVLLKQFMDHSSPFLRKHPDQMLLWQLRAACALSLNDPMAGYEAGEKLLTSGAADSNDPNLQHLMAQLNLQGWLDKNKVEDLQKQQAESSESARLKAEHDEYTFPVVHYIGAFVWDDDGYGHLTINENDFTYVGSDETIRIPRSDIREVQGLQGVSFLGKKRNFRFAVIGEDAVANKTGDSLKPWMPLADAVAKRWKFIKTDDKLYKLRPVAAAQNSAPMSSPTAKPAAPAAQSFAHSLNNSAPVADAPASEHAARNAAFMNNPAPEPGVPAEHGFAAVDNPAPLAPASNTTVLHLYRPHHLTAAMQKPDVYIDGNKITKIANSQAIQMVVAPGKHTISVSKRGIESEVPISNFDMGAGKEYWVRVEISAGAWAAHSKLFLVPSDQALSESNRMEEIKLGDVTSN